jgi:predicted component of type VI protein secretion system
MQAKLKVLGGKNNGMLIDIPIAEFLIGRGQKAHLRPSSDLVSREHCILTCSDGKVRIKDLNSRNGTFVNDSKIEGEAVLQPGDKIKVGRLVFEIVVDHSKPTVKKKPVGSTAEVGKRVATNATNGTWDDESVSEWIDGAPEVDDSEDIAALNSETKQFVLDNSASTMFTPNSSKRDSALNDTIQAVDSSETIDVSDSKADKKKKSEPIKLPKQPKKQGSESTKTAADEVLRQFFNRR